MSISKTHIVRGSITRKYMRSAAIMLSVAIVAGTMFAVAVFFFSSRTALARGAARFGAEIAVVPKANAKTAERTIETGQPNGFHMAENMVWDIPRIKDVQSVSPVLFLSPEGASCDGRFNMLVVGFEPSTDFIITPWRQGGKMRTLGPDEALAGHDTACEQGRKIVISGREFTVKGKLIRSSMGFIDKGLLIDISSAQVLLEAENPGLAKRPMLYGKRQKDLSVLFVKVGLGDSVRRAVNYIKRDFPMNDVMVSDDTKLNMSRHIGGLMKIVAAVSGAVWAMSFLILGTMFSMIVNERQRELGLMRSLGATRLSVAMLVLGEVFSLCLMGSALGITITGGLMLLLRDAAAVRMDMVQAWPGMAGMVLIVAACTGLAVITGLVAALGPALGISMKEPARAIAKGD